MTLEAEGVIAETLHAMPTEYLERIKIVTNVPNQFMKAHKTDAGYDLLADETHVVYANDSRLISTGLKVGIPKGYVGIIKARSGLSVKHGIDVGAGVVDCGYTGDVGVLLRNTSKEAFRVNKGDKIAQMVVIAISPYEVLKVNSLDNSDRGSKGYNSTGYNHES